MKEVNKSLTEVGIESRHSTKSLKQWEHGYMI